MYYIYYLDISYLPKNLCIVSSFGQYYYACGVDSRLRSQQAAKRREQANVGHFPKNFFSLNTFISISKKDQEIIFT